MVVEVFNKIGEAEMHEGSNSFGRFNKFNRDDDSSEPVHKVESSSKKLTEAKKEFLEHLEDDSLTIDTCENVNRDWKKR